MTIAELNRRFNTADISKFAGEAVVKYEKEITTANKEQLLDGERSDGEKVTPQYASKSYANWKYKKNSRAGLFTPDLKKEGDFHEGFYVELAGDNKYKVSSRDSKTGMLTSNSRYTPMIFGLNLRNSQDVGNRYVQPDFVTRLKAFLFR